MVTQKPIYVWVHCKKNQNVIIWTERFPYCREIWAFSKDILVGTHSQNNTEYLGFDPRYR